MKKAKTWMFKNAVHHIDPHTVILCMTTLAEDCANALYDRAAQNKEFELVSEVACVIEQEGK